MPAVPTVGSINLGNELSKLNLEPAWEMWRRYLFIVSIWISMFPFYMILGGLSLHCLPVASSEERTLSLEDKSTKLTGDETSYVNSRCVVDNTLLEMNVPAVGMLILNVTLMFMSSSWLYLKPAFTCLKNFAHARQEFLELVLSAGEIKRLCSKIMDVDNEEKDGSLQHRKIRRICLLLTAFHPKPSLFVLYGIRCKILAVGLSLVLAFSIAAYFSLQNIDDIFTCRIPELVRFNPSDNVTSSHTFICTINESRSISFFLLLFISAVVLQLFYVLLGLFAIHGVSKYHPENASKSLKLLVKFAENSTRSETFRKFVHYVYSVEFEQELHRQIGDIIERRDCQLIRIKAKISGTTPEVIQYLSNTYENDKCKFEFPAKKYSEAIQAAKYTLRHDSTLGFIEKLKNAKDWRLLVTLLENSGSKRQNQDLDMSNFSFNIPFDEVDVSTTQNRHSILYYAFEKRRSAQPRFIAAKVLCHGKKLNELELITKPPSDDRSNANCDETKEKLESFLLQTYSAKEAKRIFQILSLKTDDSYRTSPV